jgi:hypothetical protein
VTRKSLRNSLPRTIAACATSIDNEVLSLLLLCLHKQNGRQQASIQNVLGRFNTILMHFANWHSQTASRSSTITNADSTDSRLHQFPKSFEKNIPGRMDIPVIAL